MAISKACAREAQRACEKRGFVKCGANWYRCYGQNLLQVVTLDGFPERTSDVNFKNQKTASFGVYSMYDWIFWVNFPIMGARRDLIPKIMAGEFVHKSVPAPFLGAEAAAKDMVNFILPFLDELKTHAQLADLLEEADRWAGREIRMNDSNKVVPYLLSGKPKDAVAVIDSIVKQNLQALEVNSKILKKYDPILQKQKMDEDLKPLVSMRNEINSQNVQAITELLVSNYNINFSRIQDMQILPSNMLPCNHTFMVSIWEDLGWL